MEGLLFIATGIDYLQEAACSAKASLPYLNGRPIAVVTDSFRDARKFDCFDHVIVHPQPCRSYRDKIPPLLNLPYKRTLFLDTDARLTSSVESMFAVLGRAHIAAAHAPVRIPDGWVDRNVPCLFPEVNSGVLLLRKSLRQKLLVSRWLSLYDKVKEQYGQSWDQASLRSALWHLQSFRGLRLAVLPAEANLRTTKPWIAGKGLQVNVVHGRVPNHEWPAFLSYLNDDIDRFRSWNQWLLMNPQSCIRPKLPPDPVGI